MKIYNDDIILHKQAVDYLKSLKACANEFLMLSYDLCDDPTDDRLLAKASVSMNELFFTSIDLLIHIGERNRKDITKEKS